MVTEGEADGVALAGAAGEELLEGDVLLDGEALAEGLAEPLADGVGDAQIREVLAATETMITGKK